MEKEKGRSSILGVLILIILIVIAGLLIYMIVINYKINFIEKKVVEQTIQNINEEPTNQNITKNPAVNEALFTNIGKTYGELKETLGGIKSTNTKEGYVKAVYYNNGYTAFYGLTDTKEDFKDSEIAKQLLVEFKDLFLNYNANMLNNEELQKVFTSGVKENPDNSGIVSGRSKTIMYKGYTITVRAEEDNEGNDKGYSENSYCTITK